MKNGPGAMNRVYRLVWNDRTGAFVAVAERTRSRGKRSSGVVGAVLAAGLLAAGGVLAAGAAPAPGALPTGGSVVSGQASLAQAGTRLDITQASARAAINWQSFDIGSQAQVNISQPGAQSVLLNRVVGADASGIFGKLTSNGQVLLVNPNGIVFGAGSQVDVGGIVASTLDIADADFSAGRMKFTRNGANGANGTVLNQGTIKARAGGYVALLAPEVVNDGVISAQLGTVALAAGDAVTLQLDGSALLGVRVDPATIDALVENRQLVQAEGGRVFMSVGAAQRLREQAVAGASGASALVDDGGTMRLVAAGGRIEAGSGQVHIEGSSVDLSGQVRAGGIGVQADYIGQGGTLDASNAAGAGGRITLNADTTLQTASARLLADGSTAGGSIRIDGGSTLYSSATFSAGGAGGLGGDIAITAASVQLRAALLDASGSTGGGRIRVGGGFQGQDGDLANARELGVNGSTVLRADATVRGDGGQIVLWSDDRTVYGGQLSARGGVLGGDGGRAEVSGKGDLSFAGGADLAAPAGSAGRLLLDPRNILIDNAGSSLASLNLADPTPSATNGFGTLTQVLDNGNVIITAPNAATGGSANTGAVYLFNSSTGALLSNLRGSHAGDHAGSAGVQVLGNGNYLVLSPQYGTVSGVNTFSLSTGDSGGVPGASAYAIQQNTSAAAGAITWQSAAGSSAGLIGSGNSLLGSTANTDSVVRYSYSGNTVNTNANITVTANDRLGNLTSYDIYGNLVSAGTTTVTELKDGNVAIAAPNWSNGRGAVAWMNASTGALVTGAAGGTLSASTALVGSTPIRSLAPVATDSNSKKVYVLGVDQSLPYTYTQGSTNRRTAPPGAAGDSVGQILTALPGGGYAIASPLWSNGGTVYAGAATRGAAGGSAGTVAASNSLVGSHAYDFVGSGGITAVGATGSSYIVASPYWSDSANNVANGRYLENNPNGAVTWIDGSTGNVFGTSSPGAVVTNVNSLAAIAGSVIGARSSYGSSPTASYDYNTSYQLTATYSTRTQASLDGGLKLLANGNYLVVSNAWNGGRGAVTFGSGTAGVAGVVNNTRSLVGTTVGDSSNSRVVELSGSNYVVVSPGSDLGAVDGGAITWGSGTSGVIGNVSTANSLYGTQVSAAVGSGGVLPVGTADGQGLRPNFIVLSPNWGNRSATTSTVSYGAVTWVDGSNGFAWGQSATGGAVSAGNSLVGSTAGDYVGSIHTADTRDVSYRGDGSNLYQVTGAWNAQLTASVDVLANGDYLVRSPNWGSGKGAVSWGAGASGTGGAVSSSNSLVGSTADVLVTGTATQTRAGISFTDTTYKLTTTGDHVGLLGQTLSNGNYIAISPYWNGGRGAITWVGSGNRTGTVGSANSLVGSTPDTYSDVNHSALTASGDRLGTMPDLSWVVPVVSEATLGGQTVTTTTSRPTGPYGFDTSWTVNTNYNYSGGGSVALGRNYSVTSPQNASQSSDWGYLTTNFLFNGYPLVKELSGGNVLVASPGWNNGSATRAGAVSWIHGATGALAGGGSGAALSATNSLVGSHSDDVLGFRLPLDGFAQLSNGNFLLVNPQWYAERGAATWGSGTAGVTGTVSSANSLVGSTASAGLGFSAPTDYVMRIVGGNLLNYDWVDRSSNGAGDRVGAGGVAVLADGNAVIGSPLWSQTSAWTQQGVPSSLGAATWINGSNGQLMGGAGGGSISASNSLVGSQHGDAVGYSAWVDPGSEQQYLAPGITALAGGRYAVASPWWSNGSKAGVGAVTFGAAGGIAGVVSTANSLVGASAGDHVGRSLSSYDPYSYAIQIQPGVQVLNTGSATHYMVRSTDWTNTFDTSGGGAGAGAVTWVNGNTGRAYGEASTGAAVSAGNSLVGNAAGDGVGSQMLALTRQVNGQAVASGDFLLLSGLAYCAVPDTGAITLLSGSSGAAGPIGWRNSVVGLASSPNGLSTAYFDGWSFSTDIRATLLPTAVTGAEQVAWRPLVWVAPNAGSGKNASQALVLTQVADNNAAPVSANQVNGSGGNANWGGSLFAGNGSGFTGVGGNASTGLLGFSAHSGSDVVITPATLTALLNAGTAVTLQASNDITVLRDITVSAGGAGGDFKLEAGRSIYLRANISTDNGTFTAIANQSAAAGVVNGDCSSCEAVIVQAAGTRIDAGSSHIWLNLLAGTDKTNNAAGTVRVASLFGDFVQVSNAGISAGGVRRGIRFNSGAVIGNGNTERIEIYAGGNSATGGGIVLASDTQLVGSDTLNLAPSDLSQGFVLGAASGGGLALTLAEMSALIKQGSGFGSYQFGSGDLAGATVVNALDFTQPSLLRGSSTLAANVEFTGGSGGINVVGALKSGAANGYSMGLFTFDGAINFGAASTVTATTGNLVVTTFGGSLTQTAGSTLNATRLYLGGDGAATLTAGTNTIGTLGGNFGSASIKTTSSVAIDSGGFALDNGLVLQASGASSDITLGGTVSTGSGNLVLAAGRNFVNNKGNSGLDAGSGRWLVYSTNPAATTEGMASYSKHYAQSYSAGSTPGYAASGNWFLYSVAPTLTITAGSGSTVTYGSSASAPSVGITGFIDGDTLASATSGSLNTSLSSYTASGAGTIPAGSYTLALNGQGSFTSALGYTINVTTGSSTLTVQPKAINVAGLAADSKVYDGTTTTTVSGTASLTGGGSASGDGKFLTGDALSISGTASGSFADRHAGTAKSVTLSGLVLAGADRNNYSISTGSVTADITPKTLIASGLSVAASKVYDGSTAASVTGSAALRAAEAAGSGNSADGKPYSGDTISLGGTASASYNAAGVAAATTVSFGGLTLGGAQAGDYVLSLPSQAATITPKALTVSGVTAQNKVYDGGTAASFTGTAALAGVVGSDAVNLSGTLSGSFADANAGIEKAISTSGLSLTGGGAGNYSLGVYAPVANISRRTLDVSAQNASKTYGDTDPTLTYTVGGLGLVGSDTAGSVFTGALSTTTGAAATAGTHAITQGSLAVGNTNYQFGDYTAGTLTVAKASLAVTADDKSKTYGNADPTLTYTVNASQLKYADTASVVSEVSLGTVTGAAATAGTHAITATGGAASNYTLTLNNGTLNVSKAALSVTADNKAKTYGDADPALSYTVNASQLKYADSASVVSEISLGTVTGAAATAGSHAITATGGAADNYTLTLNNGALSVAKAALGVTADNKAKTYGDADPTLSYTVNAGQLKYADSASVVSEVSLGTVTGAAATAGSHAITATGGAADNYTLTLSSGTLNVAKAALGVTADNKAKTYGDADPTLSYTVNAGQLKYADGASVVSEVNLSTTTGAAATAGTHAITASGGAASNYTLTLNNGTLNVAKAALSVTADNKSKTYGNTDPTLTYTVNASQLKYADSASVVSEVSLGTVTGAAATAGTHAITATGGAADNYTLTLSNGTLNVAKAALSVTADNKAKTYGDADPALSYTVNAGQLKYADSASVVSEVSLGTVTGAAATAGSHAITATGGAASNYTLTLNNGALSVAKAALSVTADNKAKTYGDADPTLGYTVNASQLKYADSASVVSEVSLGTVTGAAATAGTHAITATGGAADNYTLTLNSGTLNVAKAALGVTADNKSKTYGNADPTLSYTVNASQLKYADSASVVSEVSLSTVTGAAATAGTHAITATGGAADNYTLTLNNGTLSVAKAALSVTANDKAKTYGDADPTLSYTVNAAQLKYADSASVVSGVSLGTTTGAAATAGTHAITATGGAADNYTLTLNSGTLNVAKATLGVTADNKAKTYGDADPTLSYTVNASQLKYADSASVVSEVSLGTVTGAAATAGTHVITATGGAASNYTLTLNNGALSVAKAALGVTADNKAKTYGDADPTLSYTVNAGQLKYSDSASVVSEVSLGTTTGAAATAGTHAITATGGAADNYTLTLNNGTLSVAKAALGVTADNKAKTYGDADPTLSYTVNAGQLKYSDSASVVSEVNLSTTTGAAATAGTHAITATGGAADNYTLTLSNGTLSVAKAALGVTADNKSKTYGDAEPALSYTVNASQLKYQDSASVVSEVNLSTATGAAAMAGTHAITATGGAADNYTLSLSNGTLNVAKAALSVTADNKAKTYGDADPALSYTVNAGQLKYADSASVVSEVSLGTVTGAAATAGTHAIGITGGAADNYTLTLNNGTLNVAKAALGVTADNKAKTYGDADPTLSYTVNAGQLKYSDSASVVSEVNLSTTTGATATAGTHAITATGGAADNYTLTLNSGRLNVAKAALGVAADNKAKTYGDADPTLSYTVNASQLKYADSASVVSEINLSTATGAAATAGTHAITASGGAADNYTLSVSNGTLNVAKAALVVTADNKAKTYGDADPTLSYTVNAGQLKYADSASVVSEVSLGTVTGAAATAGTHAITATGGAADNYTLTLDNGILNVAKANLGVTADNKAKTYGDADPALSYNVNTSQLKYEDRAAVVSGVNLSTPTGAAATAGSHAITATGGVADNYTLVLNDGTLIVAKAALNVTADNRAKTYGDADPALSWSVNANQLKYSDTASVVSGVQLSTATGAAATAGTHVIAAAAGAADNYALTLVGGTLSVAKAALMVSANDQSKTAGERDPSLDYSVNTAQLKYTDTPAVVSGVQLSAPGGPGLPPGDYGIVAAAGVADNYALQYTDGKLTVKPSPSVKAENLNNQQGAASSTSPVPAPTATSPGAAAGTPGVLVVRDGGVSGGASTGSAGTSPGAPAAAAPAGASTPGQGGTTDAAATGSNAGSSASTGAAGTSTTGSTSTDARTSGAAATPLAAIEATPAGRLVMVQAQTQVGVDRGQVFTFDASANFDHPPELKVEYSARLADGKALPDWLKLDTTTGVLSGQPPARSRMKKLEVIVRAAAEGGAAATTRVNLQIGKAG